MVRPHPPLPRVLVILGLAGLISACAGDPSTPVPTQRPIVGGTPVTSGHLAVGALTWLHPQYGYQGAFCTGTLIAPNWVLTAAHCIDGAPGGGTLTASQVLFYVGTSSDPSASGWPASGQLYQAGGLYANSQYNSTTQYGDIALVYLAETVTGVTPYSYNTASMGGSWLNQYFTYVGFGANNGVGGPNGSTGSGIKRIGQIPVEGYDGSDKYLSDATLGVGVCYGDSGGPGLVQNGGSWRVMGVNSAVGGSVVQDTCLGHGTHTRTDLWLSFLTTTMGVAPPNCNTTPGLCMCPAACQAGGTCNNAACQTLTCEGVVTCMDGCAANDSGCPYDCYYSGTASARSAYDAYAVCMTDHCASATDVSACINQNCMNEYYGCFPPTDCDITGGDCAAGEACYPADGGRTDCYASNGLAEGATCPNSANLPLDCGDGLLCVSFTSVSYCVPFCQGAGDCDAGDYCYMPIFTGISDIGVCVCVDEDSDGYCQADDCDDNNAQTHPNATERCGDNEDNDCDGEVDEVCTVCVDDDSDGYCSDVDCDDGNAAVNPGATERCNDGVDNNCDGQIDEGCTTCVDVDQDGYCNTADCDDNNALVHPGAVERCNDGLDNDCDGQADEGCGFCQDSDGDGYCADTDCDDLNPAVYPGAAEVCGDGLDNDCDGTIDVGCTCVDDDGDGYCLGGGPQGDCNDANPYQNPGAPEVCDNGMDDNCNGVVDESCGAGDRGGCAQGGGAPGLPASLLLLLALGLVGRRRRR